jgi:hypothetical protein
VPPPLADAEFDGTPRRAQFTKAGASQMIPRELKRIQLGHVGKDSKICPASATASTARPPRVTTPPYVGSTAATRTKTWPAALQRERHRLYQQPLP